MPSIDQGVQAFAWAFFFFVFLWFGMWLLGIPSGTGLVLSLLAAGVIFLFVRVRGEDHPGPRPSR